MSVTYARIIGDTRYPMPVTYARIIGDSRCVTPSPVLDKGDGRRPHTGGLVTEKGDGSLVKSVTYYITYVMSRRPSPFCSKYDAEEVTGTISVTLERYTRHYRTFYT